MMILGIVMTENCLLKCK